MKELNLCEILKGHEGETFYSPILGSLTFVCTIYPDVRFRTAAGDIWDINPNGKLYNNSDELCVFPSKNQRDWNKFDEEQKHKAPKTWSELIKTSQVKLMACGIGVGSVSYDSEDMKGYAASYIEKSALAFLKIHQLIEVGYGGNITNPNSYQSLILWDYENNKPYIDTYCNIFKCGSLIRIKPEYVEEFLKYPENVQLLKDYFMI